MKCRGKPLRVEGKMSRVEGYTVEGKILEKKGKGNPLF